MSDRVMAFVHYYAREGYARQVQVWCNEVLKKRANDPSLVFWRSFGLICEGSTPEAMRELQAIAHVPDLDIAVAAAQLVCHEAAKMVDQEAVIELQTRLDVEEKTCSDAAALHLAAFYLYTNSKERARGLAERVLRMQPDHIQAMTLLGWIILEQQKDDEYDNLFDEGELDEALQHFEMVIEQHGDDLEAMMGKAKAMELKKLYGGSLDLYTEMTVKFPFFTPALLEKARLLLCLGDWEQVNECVGQILANDKENISALAYQALFTLTREGSNKAAVAHLQALHAAINKVEPKNAEVYARLARPFMRLACGDPNILSITGMMAERAAQLKPMHAPYLVDAAFNRVFTEDAAAANERFNQALAIDELNLDANAGALECSIMLGDMDTAMSQAMFLQEMYSTQASMAKKQREGEPPQLLYLQGLLNWKLGNSSEGLSQLERCITGLFEVAAEYPLGLEMYTVLSPNRIVGIVKMLLSSVGGEPRAATEAPSPLISKCNRALDLLAKQAPALMEMQLQHARALYLNGNLDIAQRKAADILRNNPQEYSAHMLICSCYVHLDQPELALSALDQAVSANLAVRETPLYHIVNAKVMIANNKMDEARKVLEVAMNLPGVRTALSTQQRARMTRRIVDPTLSERATIYLMLADVLMKTSALPDAPEAKKYIQDALREFEGTSEEVRVTVADCELAIARGDVEGALKKLRKIPATSPHYTKARMAMADIYLRHRKDKAAYIKCYMDLVDKDADYDTYCMLGEAFMQIQEPEKAVKAFEEALALQPKDTELISKIARALVTTHDYQRALDFYNKSIHNQRSNFNLQLELATLLMRLRQWQQSMAVLQRVLERSKENPGSVENLTLDVEAHQLMARVYKGSMDMDAYLQAGERALELQKALLSKLRGELPEALAAQREKTAGICFELAEHHKRVRRFDKAMDLYNEALRHCDTHSRSMLALAKLHLANGDTDACQQQCLQLLKHDPNNEEASIMLAELMFHQEHYDTAIYHFQQLLERSPNHYGALAQLIQLLRRAGRLDDVPRYMTLAENATPKAVMDPGFHYCKGLYNRYINDPRQALSEFNLARKDTKWGTPAVLHMAEIYLNPDNDAVWEEKENMDTPESIEAVQTARALLSQVRAQDTQSQRFRVLECYAMMASKDRNEIEAAMGRLLDMANQDANNVPVLLAMATGFMMLKQTPKARNNLKRVQKIQYKPDEAEEFERSWLLLADIHIQGGKFDLAQDLCQKCLKYNKSCSKAWEYMGAIMEREQAYKDAADHYEQAWKHENQASAQVGYKLAFNYLKAKRFVEAIDVCHKVIKAFPDYPKIRKDILEKARMGLKP